MLEATKQELTAELRALEGAKDSADAFAIAQKTKAFQDRLKTFPSWDDSRSSTSASFLNLINDTNTYQEFFTLADLKSRTTELLVYLSHKLTPVQAQSLGIQAFQRASSSQQTLETAQRLTEPGSSIFETARELPDPLVDEAKRRGTQASAVGQSVAERLRPAASTLKSRFDAEGWTIPTVLAIIASIMIFTKNKMLATTICGLFVYILFKTEILSTPALFKQNVS